MLKSVSHSLRYYYSTAIITGGLLYYILEGSRTHSPLSLSPSLATNIKLNISVNSSKGERRKKHVIAHAYK